MGNNESTPLEEITKDEIVAKVKDLGDKFAEYASAIDENGVDGDLLAGMNEDDFLETLDDLGVTSRLHRRKLLQEFRKAFTDVGSGFSISGSTVSSSGWSSVSGGSQKNLALPAAGPIEEVYIQEIECRPNDYPLPNELDEDLGEVRDSHLLPTYQAGRATTAEQQSHLAENFWNPIDGVEGGYRAPIPEDDMERVAQVQAYGLEEIEPDSDVAKTLTGYVEMATKLFQFDFGDITFFDHESQFSFARVGLTEHIKEAIVGPVYRPVNYAQDESAFLCKTDRSIGICNYPSLSKRTFVVHDIHNDLTFKWMKAVWPFRCYVGTPLLSPSGLVLGTLCLHNLDARPDFGKAHEVQLEQVARMVVQAMENWSLRRRIDKLEVQRQVSQSDASKLEPPEDKKDAVFVGTVVEGLSNMRKKASSSVMKDALDLYNSSVQELCKDHFGYQVENNDTDASFLIAFHDAVDAFAFSLGLQQKLYSAAWSQDILALPEACDDGNAQKGLRASVGVHLGPAEVKQPPPDNKADKVEYVGQTVDMTRAVTSMGYGGQILCTFDTWNAASFLAGTKLESPQVIDLGTHVVRKGKKVSDGIIAKRIIQLVPAPLAVKYNTEKEAEGSDSNTDTSRKGRQFPEVMSLKKLSKSFFDAPGGNEVTIAFIGSNEIENRYKESASIIAEIIGQASTLLPQSEGYQCQNNMFAFPNITEAVKFGLRFMDLMRAQQPLEDGAAVARLVTYGCVHGTVVALEPHKTTGRADYFGKVVNRAARVAYTSEPGKICVGVTAKRTEKDGKASFQVNDSTVKVTFVGKKKLKGVEEEMDIYDCKRKRSPGQMILRWFGADEKW